MLNLLEFGGAISLFIRTYLSLKVIAVNITRNSFIGWTCFPCDFFEIRQSVTLTWYEIEIKIFISIFFISIFKCLNLQWIVLYIIWLDQLQIESGI